MGQGASMKTAHRKSSQAKRVMRQAWSSDNNPVARALRSAKAADEFRTQVLTVRIKLYQFEHGADATDLLACLAVVIGTPCEAGARQFGHTPWVSQLHGALRTIQTMCLDGYCWQEQYAHALNRAIEIAVELRNFDVDIFTSAWQDANGLAVQIMNHAVSADAVAA